MVRVLEIGQIVAGPTAGLILSELGFEVIKLEQPGQGDISRRLIGPSSGAFPFYNRNKKSITLDLKNGKEIFYKLVKTTDILIDNLASGTMEKMGYSYENLREINPGLIYVSIKGYGPGPYSMRNSLDYPIEIETGIAYMTGLNDRPMRMGGSIVDIGAAMFGVIGALKALLNREETGMGDHIEVGMFETGMFFMGQHIVSYQINQKPLKPINEEGFAWGIYDFFDTKDGNKIFIAITTDKQWKKFCEKFNFELCQDPNYEKNADRYSRRPILIPKLQSFIKNFEFEELIKNLNETGISYGIFHRPWDLLYDNHALNKMANIKYNKRDLKVPLTPLGIKLKWDPPTLGENTEEILKSLGLSETEIKDLRERKII